MPDLGHPLTTGSELLYRQVNPGKMKAGLPGKSNFVPTDEDGAALSTRREAFGAQRSYEDHAIRLKLPSRGTIGVTVAVVCGVALPAFGEQQLLHPFDDAHLDNNPPHHASIWFATDLSRKDREKIAKALHADAMSRGWAYGPVE